MPLETLVLFEPTKHQNEITPVGNNKKRMYCRRKVATAPIIEQASTI